MWNYLVWRNLAELCYIIITLTNICALIPDLHPNSLQGRYHNTGSINCTTMIDYRYDCIWCLGMGDHTQTYTIQSATHTAFKIPSNISTYILSFAVEQESNVAIYPLKQIHALRVKIVFMERLIICRVKKVMAANMWKHWNRNIK